MPQNWTEKLHHTHAVVRGHTADAIDALAKLCSELAGMSQHAAVTTYASMGRKLARRHFTPGQIGYTMFDKYLQ